MNFGFDLDGTLTNDPDVFATLMEALIDAGHEVHIISGVFAPNNRELQQRKIDGLGFRKDIHYTYAWFIDGGEATAGSLTRVGVSKRDACDKLDIALFVDDKPEWVSLINEACTCLLMPRGARR